MGRGVETRQYALITTYQYWSEDHVSSCAWCDEEVKRDYPGWVNAYSENKPCEGDEDGEHAGRDFDADDFDWMLEDTAWSMTELWPSLYASDRWVGYPYNETRIFLENGLVEISVSEYCGVVAFCVTPKEDAPLGIVAQWVRQIEPTFTERFGTMTKIGTFSNGESVFTKN